MLIKASNRYNNVYFMARCFIYNSFCLYGYRAWCCGHWKSIYFVWTMYHFNAYTSWRTWYYELCCLNCDYARQKIGLQNRILLQQSLNQTNIGGVIRLAKALFLFSFTVECIATLILSFEWVPKYGVTKGIYYSFSIQSQPLTMLVFCVER